jgi:hypothetical protein
MRTVAALARGELEVAAVDRHPGILSKVEVRRGFGV